MKRREFITLLGGAAAWPFAAHAQQGDHIRRIAMLAGFDDPDMKVFQQELQRLGWWEGRNIHIDYRYAPAGAHQEQALAKELIALQPDVIFAQSQLVTAALRKETQTIPIVFTFVIDPVGAGFVTSIPRPGGNITGISAYEPSVIGKWLEMLKEIAPKTKRVALLGNPKTTPYFDYLLNAAEAAALSFGIEEIATYIENDSSDIERAIAAFASTPNGAVAVLPESTTMLNHNLIIALVARHGLPAVYTGRILVAAGGLMSYGFIFADQYRQAAYYIDKILHGAKPSDLPVQSPTRYVTALNLKAAKALGLTVPAVLPVAADEVIEQARRLLHLLTAACDTSRTS